MEWVNNIVFWHWWILAVALITLEMLAPGTFFLWMGVSAVAVGALLWIMPTMSWEVQVLVFSVLSVVTIVIGRRYLKLHPIPSDQPALNRRGEQYINRTFMLERPIVNGVGKIKVDDTTWKVNGPDLPAGAQVRVTGVIGVQLQVESV